ncbi:type II toxin-antitoxin system RelE/ParE family toxin [Spirosoma taeanense]|uniref:Type II toxin-antitoxin system RelE/ParE family toxin n=1 Tax=Spirosoma taeanense TaxID=2735870 RepID=A0A6M5Y7Q3_9BACT|nr:type II toxin-antitoxin system RelE/ParE family toxin [Spirosoma taeanense]
MTDIYFSQEAEQQLEEIVNYLSENWSEQVKINFLALLADKLQLIVQMPEMYRRSEKREGLRECVLNRQTVLYYKTTPDSIEVVALLSARRGPDE